MILGIDIGGTKTLIATFDETGKITQEVRFATSTDYDQFLDDLTAQCQSLHHSNISTAVVSVPGLIDRQQGTLRALGNLPWKNKPIAHDISTRINVASVYIENDSKLAGLAEAQPHLDTYQRIYYITISTGIGGTLILNGKLADQVIDGEIGMVPIQKSSSIRRWEDFASGRAFVERYNKKAAEVDDPEIWREFSQEIGLGISMICCIYQPEAIIFGGGLGQHLSKFREFLSPYVTTYLHSTINQPRELLSVVYGDNSVIYGCYAYAKSLDSND